MFVAKKTDDQASLLATQAKQKKEAHDLDKIAKALREIDEEMERAAENPAKELENL